MSQPNQVLHWREGQGWLVLVGGGDVDAGELDSIYSEMISRADPFRPVIYLAAASDSPESAETLLETWQALGGTPGEVLPVWDAADASTPEVEDLLREAGVIFLGDGDYPLVLAQILYDTPLGQLLAECYAEGAMVVGQGVGAMALGQVVAQTDPFGEAYITLPGLGWLPQVAVEPHFESAATSPRLQHLLRRIPGLLGLGLPNRVALGLSPAATIETWGLGGQATITFAPGTGHG